MTTTHESDRIEKVMELDAPVSRVWRALTDHREFGEWFRVDLDQPFVVGGKSTGRMTYPGCEGMAWRALVERIDPETLFAFRWAQDGDEAKAEEEVATGDTTLVEFRLEPCERGTRLTVSESGFSALKDPRRLEFLRRNTEGWEMQLQNIASHVSA